MVSGDWFFVVEPPYSGRWGTLREIEGLVGLVRWDSAGIAIDSGEFSNVF